MNTRLNVNTIASQILLLLAICISGLSESYAIGIVISRIPENPPPQIKSAAINCRVTNAVEKTRYTQVLYNETGRPSEADFYFPVPAGASISDFVLYMDGKPVRGEVLNSDEAKNIYRDIVRKAKDPGLIEWSEKGLYRVHIFPVPAHGEQKLEIETTRQLPSDQGYFHLKLPLMTKGASDKPERVPTISCSIEISDDQAVRNIYSPTHTVKPDISNPRLVKISPEDFNPLQSDLSLYYQTSDDAIAASLLTQKSANADGYFSLRLSPPWQSNATPTRNANYIFVVDTSGSMLDDDKISQARKALKYCVNSLDAENRFNVIPFATAIDTMKPGLVEATAAQKSEANQWIDNLNARGGTNISGALQAATQLIVKDKDTSSTSGRLYTIVFITDGLPTIGISDPDQILKSVDSISSNSVRIFTFGLGNDVNTRLLDKLAESSRAVSDYISPGKDLEVPVSRFFDKVSRPALYNMHLQFDGVETLEIYPQQLPDLFYGNDLMVLGKYRNAGLTSITLTGTLNGEQKAFRFDKTFADTSNDNGYLEKLWATRKVAWLLDQIRSNGENSELRKEVEELGRKYGIVTPYTSYLAIEDKRTEPAGRADSPTYSIEAKDATESNRPLRASFQSRSMAAPSGAFDLKAESGAGAVQTAQKLSRMKQAESAELDVSADSSVMIGSKRFTLIGNCWVDSTLDQRPENASTVKIKYLSDAWFDISNASSEIKSYLALGKNIKFQLSNGKILEINESSGIDIINLISYPELTAR